MKKLRPKKVKLSVCPGHIACELQRPGSSLDHLFLKPVCLSNITSSVFRVHTFHLSSTLSMRERKDKHSQSYRWLREKKEKLVQVPTGGNMDGETELDMLETFSSSSPTTERILKI